MRREYTIIDEAGLHARPASLLVQAASKFSNDINLEFEGKNVNLKSVLLVMSLGVPQNSKIFIAYYIKKVRLIDNIYYS